MIKALFFDLDGTLLSSKKTILPSTRAALEKCREKGIKTFLATARSPMLDKMLGWSEEEFSLFDGGIYCNGACERIGRRAAYEFLASEAVRCCVAQAELYENVHAALHLENERHVFNHALPDFALAPWGLRREDIAEWDESCYDRTVKILIYYDNLIDASKELPAELFRRLRELCADTANVYLADRGRTIQVVKRNVSKFAAVEKIRRELGLDRDEVAVFGDDVNDMEMLSGYGNSVAMGNAEDRVKRISTYITKSNDGNGIAFALEEILSVI